MQEERLVASAVLSVLELLLYAADFVIQDKSWTLKNVKPEECMYGAAKQ